MTANPLTCGPAASPFGLERTASPASAAFGATPAGSSATPARSGRAASEAAALNIAICIATAGRRELLSEVIGHLAKQTRLPDGLYICPASEEDFDAAKAATFPAPVHILFNGRGSCRQRNAIIRAATAAEVMVFFDDDFLPQPSYLTEVEALFQQEAGLVVATGAVLADGINGPGISVAEALAVLAADRPPAASTLQPVYSGYGCNMAVRIDIARRHGIEFDENLPNYGWWEDVDFSRRLMRFGAVARSERLRGVHLGSKNGRSPGKRLGYAQVANIVYLMRKGSVSPSMGLWRISTNVAANLVRSLSPEPWVDRRGRLAGNLMAFGDLVRGTMSPLKCG
jgi:GT2 family glycosyltransferase